MEWKEIHAAIEGVLFAAGDPVPLERLCQALGEEQEMVEQAVHSLADEYQFGRRGLRIILVEDSVQMTSAPECAPLIRAIMEKKKPDKLSSSALEVLSVVAYYQPVTRAYIDQVRGVDSTYTLGLLLDRELVEECGRLDMPGRPILYRTSQVFLRTFGLKSLEELPELPVPEEWEEQKGSEVT